MMPSNLSAASHSFRLPLVRNQAVAGPALPFCLPRDITSRFGMRLRQLRHDHHMTQMRMAVEFGIDRTFISDVERGRKSISLPMLEVMAIGFDLTLSELLHDV